MRETAWVVNVEWKEKKLTNRPRTEAQEKINGEKEMGKIVWMWRKIRRVQRHRHQAKQKFSEEGQSTVSEVAKLVKGCLKVSTGFSRKKVWVTLMRILLRICGNKSQMTIITVSSREMRAAATTSSCATWVNDGAKVGTFSTSGRIQETELLKGYHCLIQNEGNFIEFHRKQYEFLLFRLTALLNKKLPMRKLKHFF